MSDFSGGLLDAIAVDGKLADKPVAIRAQTIIDESLSAASQSELQPPSIAA